MSERDEDGGREEAERVASLLKQARRADEGVDRITDEHGHAARIERDPRVPGATRVTVEGFEHPRIEEQMVVPAGDREPGFYPADLPFLAGFACRVMRGGGHLVVVWRDDACPRLDPAEKKTLEDSMPGGIRGPAREMSEKASAEPDPRYVDAYNHVAAATRFDGWEEVHREGSVPFAIRSLLAEKEGRRRLVTLSGILGQSTLTLTEGPPREVGPGGPDPAPPRSPT